MRRVRVAAYLANCSYGYDSTEGIAPRPNRTTKADALAAQYATAESVLVDHANSGKQPQHTLLGLPWPRSRKAVACRCGQKC